MRSASRRPGAPLAALLGVIVMWIAARAVLWETPLLPRMPGTPRVDGLLGGIEPGVEPSPPSVLERSAPLGAGLEMLALEARRPSTAVRRGPMAVPARMALVGPLQPLLSAPDGITGAANAQPGAAAPFRLSPSLPTSPPSQRRWAADAWLFVRRGEARLPTGTPAPPAYGASQVGAVLRYRLVPNEPASPTAYLRVTSALDGAAQRDAAAGLAARPLAAIPLVAIAEARLSETADRRDVRPAVMLVSEFPPLALGQRAQAAGYVQAGYVGGRFATAFVDGQVQVTRVLIQSRGATVSAGAGVWGGAQRGASRIDLGPTAAIQLPLGRASARLAIDYRFRAVGDAQPDSGPAVTLSTGF